MLKDHIFFGEHGLTSTSANHVANLAKEAYAAEQKALDNISFLDTSVQLIGSASKTPLEEGWLSVHEIPSKLEYIASLKALIAWLREAIKAKQRLLDVFSDATFKTFNIEVPEKPEREPSLTEDEYLASLSIKERNRYYYLDTFCATIGKYIHPDGTYAEAREQLQKALHHPNRVEGTGRDALLFTAKPSLPVQDVEDMFMQLQQTYREYQAELNSMKHKMETALAIDATKKAAEYEQRCSVYYDQMTVLSEKLALKKQEAVDTVTRLKIVIPDSLQLVYQSVNSLGK